MTPAVRIRRLARHARRLVTQPWLTRDRIVSDLRALGLRGGELLMVHPALSPLGHVLGGPRTVIEALHAAVGERGTLVLPAHTWQSVEEGSRTFDVRRTPCCVGAIAEAFRTMPGAVRSLHPTHSVAALGPLADQIIEGHDRCRYPCGPGSPYVRVMDLGGRILLLGLGFEYNTAYHAVEALAEVPYLLTDQPETFTLIDAQGQPRAARIHRHRRGAGRRLSVFDEMFSEAPFIARGYIGAAPSLLFDASAFRDRLLSALRDDPACLLSDSSPWKRPGGGVVVQPDESHP